MPLDVLIVGSGSRENALAWKAKQSPRVDKIFVAPGNGGTKGFAESVPIGAMEIEKLAAFALEKKIGLTIAGMDDSIAAGIVDTFQARGLKIFGPTKAAAQIEWSKAFAKQLMKEAGVPTAEFQAFTDHALALQYVRSKGARPSAERGSTEASGPNVPIVVKASGLALGKGVYVCKTLPEAEEALKEIMLDKQFGTSGSEVVIEEFLEGQEISIHALCDGKNFLLFPPAQDHKQIGEGDTGPNTGGMGVIVPVPWVSLDLMGQIGETIVRPILNALAARGTPFKGILFPGLIMTKEGPKVLEFNARFGAPECEAYMRILKSDLIDLCEAAINESLYKPIEWEAAGVFNLMLASGGYPGEYKKGFPITGIEEAEDIDGVVVFHAGTVSQGDALRQRLVTTGGRVLAVTATGNDLWEAHDRAYLAADRINFEGKYLRHDIGKKALT